jgi:carboxyl-terminal processing protease
MKQRIFGAALAAMLAAPTVHAQDPLPAGVALATFDTVWARINRTFYDTAFLNTRWVALRDSLRPVAAKATTNDQLRGTLQVMLGSIGTSHFGIITRESSPALNADEAIASANPGSIGLQLRAIGTELFASRVENGSPAWRAGVRPGMSIKTIGNTSVATTMQQVTAIENPDVRKQTMMAVVMQANARLNRAPGDSIKLDFGRGPVFVTAEKAPGQMSKFGNLPPMSTRVEAYERRVNGKRIGVIAFSVWMPVAVAQIDSAVDRFRDADGIIFDVRGNPGGVAGMVGGVAGHVVDSQYVVGTLIQRGATLSLRANPRRVSTQAERVAPYAGPVAVLIDPLSASASEFFAAGLQGWGRARVFGETSAGASVPALMGRLPNGDVLLHAIADHKDSKGRRVEGVGVIPDEVTPLNAASLAAGRDDALDAALRWAAAQTNK